MKKLLICSTLLLISCLKVNGDSASLYIQKGWDELLKDNDTTAFKLFSTAYELAKEKKDYENSGNALLDMGICTYGASFSFGISYCLRAMEEFKKLETEFPGKALTGRSKCLLLISTIKSRQGKYHETISLSKEAMAGFANSNDTTGYLGLIYNSLGEAYSNLNQPDSAEFFHRLALKERLLTGKYIYLPGSYCQVAAIELNKGNKEQSRLYYNRALTIADSMGNRQAQVLSLVGLGNWFVYFEKNINQAENSFLKAKSIAYDLSDKSFYLKCLNSLMMLKKQQGKYADALAYSGQIQMLKDSLSAWEKERIIHALEVQFDLAEKERMLNIVRREKDIATLTNYILWGTFGFLVFIAIAIIIFQRRINKKDKLLLLTNEQLGKIEKEQKILKEKQLQNELEFKESQLSAMAVQMLQKNELLQELNEQLEKEKETIKDNSLKKIINKGLSQDKEWADFNASFESINKNFYSRLKLAYPDISPNDLKICALIKLNLSIKEMAAILNISPDSVKTARYRLRKKLQLNTEDNLTDFILNLQ